MQWAFTSVSFKVVEYPQVNSYVTPTGNASCERKEERRSWKDLQVVKYGDRAQGLCEQGGGPGLSFPRLFFPQPS